ncbi:hypothetical protein [Rhodococcoides corynebacterioides]|uniref:Uncharacterized protein n=1 Tax=Rhodococcoides corynebacterioides TaxID=53972 RepID=A0ABS7NZU9_9NOCA|nr:hypothetical protein [Rhodococcus corynebacterioides]MBY6365668.1 hypothetical protein [Rhodococcus corynebacterioides]MBY6406399.1 hypothetical protein [Rhodococcus corynebacterioides]
MTVLWMLEDLEWWPNAPEPRDVFSPTTYWASPEEMDLPPEVVTETPVTVEEVHMDGYTERIAHLGNGFTTLLGKGGGPTGVTMLTGCLVWDHYLWTEYRTTPTGNVRLVERRGGIVQRVTRDETTHPGVFSIHPSGPTKYQIGEADDGYEFCWHASMVELVHAETE